MKDRPRSRSYLMTAESAMIDLSFPDPIELPDLLTRGAGIILAVPLIEDVIKADIIIGEIPLKIEDGIAHSF